MRILLSDLGSGGAVLRLAQLLLGVGEGLHIGRVQHQLSLIVALRLGKLGLLRLQFRCFDS